MILNRCRRLKTLIFTFSTFKWSQLGHYWSSGAENWTKLILTTCLNFLEGSQGLKRTFNNHGFSLIWLQNQIFEPKLYPEFLCFSQDWLWHHIFEPQLSIQKSDVVCIYAQCTNIIFRSKVLVSPRLAHTRAAPIGIVVFPFVCGVNVGGTCVC